MSITTDPVTYIVLILVGSLALLFGRYVKRQLGETLEAVKSPKGRTALTVADEAAEQLNDLLGEVRSLRSLVSATAGRQERTERYVGAVDDRVNSIGDRVERVERSTARAHERIDRILIPTPPPGGPRT
jgi:hypothetical protein